MRIEHQAEYQLSEKTHRAIQQLLEEGFENYPRARDFFRQLPTSRMLAWSEEGELIGHLAVEHRIVNNDGQLWRVFGIADFTVAKAHRNQRIGSTLLQSLTELGRSSGIDFLLLLAHDSGSIYAQNGFLPIDAQCKWLLINQDQSLGVLNRYIANSLMIKPLGNAVWRSGFLDFLGHIF
jgi:predicted N-acetyltransferase YhbS